MLPGFVSSGIIVPRGGLGVQEKPGISRELGERVEYVWVCAVDVRVLAAVVFGLAAFGYGYNRWVAGVVKQGQDRGYLSLIVSLGVGVTVLGFGLAVWSLWAVLVLLGCFVASGAPMIIGSISRYMRERAEEVAQARVEARRELGGE